MPPGRDVVWSRAAKDDLTAIADHLAQYGEDKADRMRHEIKRALAAIVASPYSSSRSEHFSPDARVKLLQPFRSTKRRYTLVYRVKDDVIEIGRLFAPGMDVRTRFADDPGEL